MINYVRVHRRQVIAARALLGWNQIDLAAHCCVALPTIKRFESGAREPIPAVNAAIAHALERAGVVFHNDGKKIGVSIEIKK